MQPHARDEAGVMQVVEAILALAILILAIGWAVQVADRGDDPAPPSDELRQLTRQALALIDATDSPGKLDTVSEFIEACGDEHWLAAAILEVIGDGFVNLHLDGGAESAWLGSASRGAGAGTSYGIGEPLPRGFETSVVRYLTEADPCDDDLPSGILTLRVEVWRA